MADPVIINQPPQDSSSGANTVLLVVIIILILGLGYWGYARYYGPGAVREDNQNNQVDPAVEVNMKLPSSNQGANSSGY